MRRLSVVVSMVIGGVLIGSVPTVAHHASGGLYTQEEKTITGTVKAFRFVNPHPVLLLDVKNGKGVVETWTLQVHAATRMARMFNWNRGTFKFGDTITILGNPAHKGRIFRPIYVTFPDGRKEGVAGSVNPNNY